MITIHITPSVVLSAARQEGVKMTEEEAFAFCDFYNDELTDGLVFYLPTLVKQILERQGRIPA